MDNRPIGFFDSGLGGLNSIPYMRKMLPQERIIYFGDTARTPYGSKAVSTVQNFSLEIADFLVQHQVKMIVIACNTVSATCLDLLQEKYPEVPIIGVIQPAAQKVINTCGTTNRIGVIGTKVTISTHTYKNIIKVFNPNLHIVEKATPGFVPLIEEGIIDNDIMDLTIQYYLDDFVLANRLDTLILGCTHYPLIKERILRLYPELRIINPSKEVVHNIGYVLKEKNMEASGSEFTNTYYASDLSENFLNMIDRICGADANVQFKNLETK